MLNWYSFGYDIDAERNALDTLLQKIGAAKLTDDAACGDGRLTTQKTQANTGRRSGWRGRPLDPRS